VQVLWDYSKVEVDTVAKLIAKLQQRFGDSMQPEKCRVKLKSCRRQPGETLQHLHSDICHLTALAFPKLEDPVCMVIACDYFIDALNDPVLELAL